MADCPVIGLMGAPLDTGNRGVSALGTGLVNLFAAAYPDAQLVMLIGHGDSRPFALRVNGRLQAIPIQNFRHSLRARWNEHLLTIVFCSAAYGLVRFRRFRRMLERAIPWIGTVANAAMIGDIRGGDSFSDIYGLKGYLLSSLPVISVIWVRGSIVLFPQTYGPYRHWLARTIARYILRRARPIFARDLESLTVARNFAGRNSEVEFCPDVAFAMQPTVPGTIGCKPPLPPQCAETVIGLNVNGLMYNGGYTRRNMFDLQLDYPEFLENLAINLLAQPNLRLLLVPHTLGAIDGVESDLRASERLLQKLPAEFSGRAHLVTEPYDQQEIKGVIGRCECFIGSRMHACIAALSQGIPTIGVAYSKKFRGVFASVNAESWVVDARELNAAAAVALTLRRVGERQAQRPLLESAQRAVRARLDVTFRSLLAPSPQSP